MRISDWSSDVCSSDLILVALDGVADLLVPRRDGGVGYGFGKDRNFDFGGHGVRRPDENVEGVVDYSAATSPSSGLTSASATSCFCSMTWSLKCPTAGDGERARPA